MSERIFNNSKVSVEFTKAEKVENISSNENISTSLGKIEKMFEHIIDDIDPTLREKADTDSLSLVATSGSYTDLINKPTIDTQVESGSTNAVQNTAIYDYVNSSISTATADFKGTYNSLTELEAVEGVDNNDYGFVVSVDDAGNTVYNRYKYDGTQWVFEYKLNNSSFTAAEWETIQSGLTKADKTNFTNHMNNTSNPHSVTKAQVGLGNVDNTSDANKPISTATQNALDGKVDKVTGKGLSTNDYTNADKEQLSTNTSDISDIKTEQTTQNANISSQSTMLDSLFKMFDGMYYSAYIDFENGNNSKPLIGDFNRIKAVTNMRRCNVSTDGTITAYEGDESYTEDGSNGQVMVYIPKCYYRVEPIKLDKNTTTNGQGYHIRQCIYSISDYPIDGFKLHPAFKNEYGEECDYVLIGAFEGCLYDTSASTIINDDAQVADFATDKLYSVAGVKPISGLTQNLTRANAEKLASNIGTDWHICDVQIYSLLQLFMLVEFSSNLQKTLGPGVSGLADTTVNNSSLTGSTSNGLLPSDIKFPNTGIAVSTTNLTNGTETVYQGATDPNKVAVEYRGVENPYGNIWEFAIGMNIYGNGSNLGGIPYICNDMKYEEEKRTDNYESVGFTTIGTSGYIKAFGYGNPDYDWLFVGSESGGSENGVIGDYNYVTTNLNGYRIAILGGRWNNGSQCGPFYWNLTNGVGNRHRNIGARVCYRPRKAG